MKPLSWLSKKFQYTKNSNLLAFVLSLCVVSSIIVVGCQIQRAVDSDPANNSLNAEDNWRGNALSLLTTSQVEYIPVYLKNSNYQRVEIGAIDTAACDGASPSTAQEFRLQLINESVFGKYPIKIELPSDASKKGVSATVERRPVFIAADNSAAVPLIKEFCEKRNGAKEFVTENKAYYEVFAGWHKDLAPDCNMSIRHEKLYCDLEKLDPRLAEKELLEIQRIMIRSWSRQPYLLSRRLSLALNLAAALNNPARLDTGLNTICRLIDHSDAMELPLALSSTRWRATACNAENEDRNGAALVGLTKALNEIEFLRQLFERTSRLGVLSIKIPRGQVPTRDVWVSLEPKSDVAEQIAQESRTLSGKTVAMSDENFDNAKACWHPLFGSDANYLKIARYLDLSDEISGISCALPETTAEEKAGRDRDNKKTDPSVKNGPEHYLADSITSDTEFVITNGRGKILRLPAGTYTYTVKPHNELDGFEDSPSETNVSTTGEITWANRRPTAQIAHW